MHGCIAIFDGAKPLKMKQAANRALRRSVLEKAMDGTFSASCSASAATGFSRHRLSTLYLKAIDGNAAIL